MLTSKPTNCVEAHKARKLQSESFSIPGHIYDTVNFLALTEKLHATMYALYKKFKSFCHTSKLFVSYAYKTIV